MIGNLLVSQPTKYGNTVIGVIYYDNHKSQIILLTIYNIYN